MQNMKFGTMEELVNYLGLLEKRIDALEEENKNLKDAVNEVGHETFINRRRDPNRLPQTNLLSSGFLARAFSVWGHFFVANLIISIILLVIYLLIMFVFLGSVLGNMPW